MTTLQVPLSSVPVLERDGTMSTPWRNFFQALYDRTGGFSATLQAADDTLTALAALNASAGLVTQLGADSFTKRTITGTSGQIDVANGAGTAGNPTLSLPNTAVVAGTYASPTSITVDAKGRVTAIS